MVGQKTRYHITIKAGGVDFEETRIENQRGIDSTITNGFCVLFEFPLFSQEPMWVFFVVFNLTHQDSSDEK
jgi:hypothetical protein